MLWHKAPPCASERSSDSAPCASAAMWGQDGILRRVANPPRSARSLPLITSMPEVGHALACQPAGRPALPPGRCLFDPAPLDALHACSRPQKKDDQPPPLRGGVRTAQDALSRLRRSQRLRARPPGLTAHYDRIACPAERARQEVGGTRRSGPCPRIPCR